MHTKIKEYLILLTEAFTLELPIGSSILSVKFIGHFPKMTVLSSESPVLELRRFRTFTTGQEIENISLLGYIGSVVLNDFSWHIFENFEGQYTVPINLTTDGDH